MAKQESNAKITTDHRLIRKWVDARGGHPATVKRTRRGDEPGVLRIDYPGYSGEEELEPIGWDEFLDKFEKNLLAFVYQDKTADGRSSRFSKLVSRDAVFEAESRKRAPAARRSSQSAGATGRGTKAVSSGRSNGAQKPTRATQRSSSSAASSAPSSATRKTARSSGSGRKSPGKGPISRSRNSGAPAPRR